MELLQGKNLGPMNFREPAIDAKVHRNALHLLVCFKITQKNNKFVAKSFKLVDLYGLSFDRKSDLIQTTKDFIKKKGFSFKEMAPNLKQAKLKNLECGRLYDLLSLSGMVENPRL